ncbi:hypothetical protein EYZ11_006667 [Aspergillus tanneri]|uniref:Uncharacterized protein n=1 Tax=Aspergillus tanneri TaxID=1220188 RepID=A0A4V3UP66_9EURO|nr:uncharacterized protein ATNIH1004_011204 [Aspergillus tanneri]KAA8642263.1 hypothetical protein ATNIH1004_011204 [Aspergillus tanneri]THC93854.1 hypothetical protein EYZ11_006667 [Aspergillus tanneri]
MMHNRNSSRPRISVEPPSPQTDAQYANSPASAASNRGSPATSKPSQIEPSFFTVLRHLQTPLCPLVSSTTGLEHPEFPPTLLAFHLLTSSQLDDLARHYHQVWPPVPATLCYPVTIRPWVGTDLESETNLQTKRRRFGRFIGLRGCESPVEEPRSDPASEETDAEMLARMDREWQECLFRARLDSDASLRLKMSGI